MFIFYLHSVDNIELITKLFIDKFNLNAKSRFLLLILFTCLHFTIDRKLIFPKINEARSRKPVNRLEESGRQAARRRDERERALQVQGRAQQICTLLLLLFFCCGLCSCAAGVVFVVAAPC